MSGTVCHLCGSMYLTLTMKAYFSDIVYTGGRTSFLMPFAFVIAFFACISFLPLISLRDELFRDFSFFLLCLQVLYIKSAQFLVPQPQYPYCHDLYPFPHPVSESGREYLFFVSVRARDYQRWYLVQFSFGKCVCQRRRWKEEQYFNPNHDHNSKVNQIRI